MASVPAYTYDDFLNTDRPYKFAYSFAENSFELAKVVEQMSKQGKAVGFTKFKTFFKEYCVNIKKSKNEIAQANVTNFDGQRLELDTGTWHTDECGVYGYNPLTMMEMQICPHPIMPTTRLVNVDTNKEKLEIAYKKGGFWKQVVVEKNLIASANKIVALSDCGIAVTSENAKSIVRYLSDVENLNYSRLPEKSCVGRCGWIEGHGFAPYIDGLVFDGEENYRTLFNSIKQAGDFEKWKRVAMEGRKTLQAKFYLAASFASVLVQPFNCLPFFVHMWSSVSGTGKTVALILATSVWANPLKGMYWKTFDSTNVGQEMTAGFLNSLPLILDEFQLKEDKKGFDKVVYQLAEGIGRTRGSKTGGLQQLKTWGNTILTNGETPLTTQTSAAGAINRIIELDCDEVMFEDPNGCVTTLYSNYGIAGRMFVEWLSDPEHMKEAKKIYDSYSRALENTDVTDKQIMAASIILTADELISGLFFNEPPVGIDKAIRFLKTKADLDTNKRAYKQICQYCSINKSKFNDDDNKGEVWGTSDDKFYYIISLQFAKICEANNVNEIALLKWLKKNKLIEVTKGNTKTKRINGEPEHCVWLKKPENDYDVIEEDPDNPFLG